MTTRGITHEATRFITATATIAGEEHAADSMVAAKLTRPTAEVMASAERGTAPTQGTDLPAGRAPGALKSTTIPAQRPSPSTETDRQREDTLSPVGRVARARVLLAATTMADRKEAFPHVEEPATAAEGFTAAVAGGFTAVAGGLTAVVAGATKRRSAIPRLIMKSRNGEKLCGERS